MSIQDVITKTFGPKTEPAPKGNFPLAKKVVSAVDLKKAATAPFKAFMASAEKKAIADKDLTLGQQFKKDIITEPAKVVKGGFDLLKQTIQAPLSFFAKVGLSGMEKFTGKPQSFDLGKTGEALFGTDKLNTFQQSFKEGKKTVKELGGSNIESVIYPTTLIGLGGVLDVVPGGSTEKSIGTKMIKDKFLNETITTIAKDTKSKEILSKLLNIFKGTPEEAKALSNKLTKVTDPVKVAEIIDKENIISEAKQNIPNVFYVDSEKPNIATKNIKNLLDQDKNISRFEIKETAQEGVDFVVTKDGIEILNKDAIKRADNVYTPRIINGFDPKAYVKEQVDLQKAAREGESLGFKGKAKELIDDFERKIIDFTIPITRPIKKALAGRKITALPEADIDSAIDDVFRSRELASQFVKDNGLYKAIENESDDFTQYLIARHAIDLDTRGITTGRDLAKDQALVRALAPQFEASAEEVTKYSQKLLKKIVDDGLISQELADKLKQIYPNYVPMNRIFSELEQPNSLFASKGVANLSKQTIVQKIQGSERVVENPLASLLQRTEAAFMQGNKNRAAQVLTSYANLPGNPLGLRLLKDGDKLKPGEEMISVFRNGVKEQYAAPKIIAEAAKALNIQQLGVFGKMMAFPVRIARLGITGINPAFIAANLAKDQLSAFINSNQGLKNSILNIPNSLKALMGALKHNELYDDWIRAGGGGTSFDLSRNAIFDSMEAIKAKKTALGRIKYTVTHPGEMLRALENIANRTEEFTRLQQFGGTRDYFLKRGFDPESAARLAAKQSREASVNFARRGEWGPALNASVLYMNAGIQGSRALIRALKTNPKATTAKIVAGVILPAAYLTIHNLSDPKKKEAYEDIADFEKENNFIYIPDNPTKGPDGKWEVIKIPLQGGISSFANMVRMGLEDMANVNPIDFKQMANEVITIASPLDVSKSSIGQLIPQAIKPTVESLSNYSFFTDRPLVSQTLSRKSPEFQVKETTSGSARLIGKEFDVSPIKVEEFIKGTFGGISQNVINYIDKLLAAGDIIPKDQIGGKSISDSMASRFVEAVGGNVDSKAFKKIADIQRKSSDEKERLNQEAEILFKAWSEIPKEEANAKLNELKKTNKPLADALLNVIKTNKKGLTAEDRQVLRLGVKNGDRAEYLYYTWKTIESEEQKKAFISEMKKKKILTEEVKKQMNKLKAQDKKQAGQ